MTRKLNENKENIQLDMDKVHNIYTNFITTSLQTPILYRAIRI